MNITNAELLCRLESISLNHKGDVVLITSSEEESISLLHEARFFAPNVEILYLPSYDSLPYDRVSPSNKILSQRSYSLTKLKTSNKDKILITNSPNLLWKYPDPDDLLEGYTQLKVGQFKKIKDIELFLANSGYSPTSCAIDAGEFSRRGDIIDVTLFSGEAYRINFEWEKIESIKSYNPETQISNYKVEQIEIYRASELLFTKENIENYRKNYLKLFGIGKAKSIFFEKIIEGIKVPGIESVAPLFYTKSSSLLDYLNNPVFFKTNLVDQALNSYTSEFHDFYESRSSDRKFDESFYPAPKPDTLLFDKDEIFKFVDKNQIIQEPDQKNYRFTPNFYSIETANNSNVTAIQALRDYCKESPSKKIIIGLDSVSMIERLKNLLSLNEISFSEIEKLKDAKKNIFNLTLLKHSRGIESPEFIVIAQSEILGDKKSFKVSGTKKLKNIFNELENFSEGDLIVHVDHGIGRYESIEQIVVDNIKHDCLKLTYAKGDRLFIPVENIGLIKRYTQGEVELDHLGGASWQRRKAKLKDRINHLAEHLIEIAARRSCIHVDPIHIVQESYNNFTGKFPHVETEDQQNSISDVINDLTESKPMDRLICGDIGYGKTEIAMRAAFLVADDKSSKKQVAIVVPTTILARQHYNNFIERFKGFNFVIKQLSRLTTLAEAKKIKEAMKANEVDIVIGTHALLSKEVKFANLGLVIVDEEQHFGVAQKERLKDLTTSVHVLTLSATPIPRTLQMSMLGIRDLSIIATPPIDRLSVRTSLITYDEVIVKDAILREKHRGGKTFFVCPRISDIDELKTSLIKLLPEIKIAIVHGQMAATMIDDVMTEFYEGRYDLLLSTAIVESGLDIPAANTMIIYKADMFGLCQLYQLRGRVGRGKIRGFSYLVLDRKKMPTKSAIKRLEIMQNIDSLGAGFSIASHDMDIRGFGNLVGDEQSGHIKEVGMELYQEMLEEAIANVKGEEIQTNKMPEIKINIPVFIPENYIEDDSTRLSIYRRAGDIFSSEVLEDFRDELADRFGLLPEAVNNLLEIIDLKVICKELGIEQLDIGSGGFSIKFNEKADHNTIMNFVSNHQQNTKIKPDNRLVYIKKIKPEKYLEETKLLLQKLRFYTTN